MTDCRSAEHDTAPSPKEHVEEYLEVLLLFQEEGKDLVKISWIAERLGIAKPSAVQMLKKMQNESFVKYLPQRGIELTSKGNAVGTRILRNHRIMEAFVKNTVGAELDGKVGCAIEHHMSEDFTNTLCTWLKHPPICPHGYPIPQGSCCRGYGK